MSVIAVRGLVRRRGGVLAVDGISFEVGDGQIFGLLGPNGAGKTSTIEVLEGLEKPDGGTVCVLGANVADDDRRIKQRIGVQLQTTGLPKYLTVFETLDLFASFYDADRRVPAGELLKRLGLEKVRNRLNSRLSGGERQRLALALALVNDPDILFLDEPSAGLDPHGRRELWSIVREWKSGRKTVFLTTHDMHEAESLCDVVAIMDSGRIVAEGSVTELIAGEAVEQAIWVQADGRPMSDNLDQMVPSVSRAVLDPGGTLIYTTDAMATMSSLLELRRAGQISFASFQLRPASLEDVFLRQTGRRLET